MKVAEKITLEQRPVESEEDSHVGILGENIPYKRESMWKGRYVLGVFMAWNGCRGDH